MQTTRSNRRRAQIVVSLRFRGASKKPDSAGCSGHKQNAVDLPPIQGVFVSMAIFGASVSY